jgi:nicotinamidase-related amidase
MTSAALLVIDIQRAAFDGVRCPPIDRAAELVSNAVALVAAARDAEAPVIFIQHCDEPDQPFEEGTPQWELHESLSSGPSDIVIKKHASSAFENTALGATLQKLEIADLVVCGLQSEFCVSNTSKAALALGYRVAVAQDGHSTWPSAGRASHVIAETVNEELRSLGAVLGSTATLAAALRARAPER